VDVYSEISGATVTLKDEDKNEENGKDDEDSEDHMQDKRGKS
jgi:hypothetical protein